MVVPFTAIVNTSKGSGGGKEGQLMSSVLLVMESELSSDKPVKKKKLDLHRWGPSKEVG